MVSNEINFKYRFVFDSGREKEFDIKLNGRTLNLISEVKEPYPEWTKLGFCKCPNCPLDEGRHRHCPIAVSLTGTADFFSDSTSYEEVDLHIETPERKYAARTPLQRGLSSMVGIYMVTSGCPIMEKLKPMVRFHLPLATVEETEYRVLSMYLMAQYFIYKQGMKPDWDMKNLADIYKEIRVVNKHFIKRLSNVSMEDASLNSLVRLDCFAMSVASLINEEVLDRLKSLFSVYLENHPAKN